ncbi:hypothetical protein AACH06_25915 [Ideonella sp. DXS29W]|uniref:SH3 domain-containing protein n=1 Tax=Ideonella lacteola TaxID=2984193 RepID=A0ABU9BXX2_9BURK
MDAVVAASDADVAPREWAGLYWYRDGEEEESYVALLDGDEIRLRKVGHDWCWEYHSAFIEALAISNGTVPSAISGRSKTQSSAIDSLMKAPLLLRGACIETLKADAGGESEECVEILNAAERRAMATALRQLAPFAAPDELLFENALRQPNLKSALRKVRTHLRAVERSPQAWS